MKPPDLRLDRMALEDGPASPEALAAKVHRQLGPSTGPIPVHAIACALDIEEILEEDRWSFEGALITQPERDSGRILLNAASPRTRRRFTLAHELGHFVIAWHQPDGVEGFRCRTEDLAVDLSPGQTGRTRIVQEGEANRFAIELLAPAHRVQRHLKATPDLEQICELSRELDISRAAAGRRYIGLHGAPLALVITRHGAVEYLHRAGAFPFVRLGRGERAPQLPHPASGGSLSNHDEVDPLDWLTRPPASPLVVQTLHQRDGWATTLLLLEDESDGDEEDR